MFGHICNKCQRVYSANWQGPCPFCEVERLQTALEGARREACTNDGVLFSELACNYVKQLADRCAEVERLQKRNRDLLRALLRANRECEHLHHDPDEYHESPRDCPVEAWIEKIVESNKATEVAREKP